jgi:hypothetical protein
MGMKRLWRAAAILVAVLGLASCDNSAKKPAAPPAAPIRMSCMNPQEAGLKARDITIRLGEELTAKRISDEDYRAFVATLNVGYQAWGERQDLKAYCAALDKVVNDAGLK